MAEIMGTVTSCLLYTSMAFSLQHTAGGCFILFCGARVIFANGDAVHELTSGYVDFHRHYTMPVSP